MARSLQLLLATLAVSLLALTAAAGASAAEAETPTATEEASTPPIAEEAPPAPMSVEFTRRRASLIGSRALVFVRCGGVVAQTCEGTLVLNGLGGAHKVPYLIDRGESQALAVPIGDGTSVDRGSRARVVARTMQLTGGTVRTSSILRVR
jgi:hypothetical protein